MMNARRAWTWIPWAALGLSLAISQLHAQEADDVEELEQRVTTFFAAFSERMAIRAAVEQLVAGGPLERNNNTEELVTQAEQFPTRYGRFLEAERVAIRPAGEDLILMTYLYKTDRVPVVWRFAFYRQPDSTAEWRVVAVSFDTNYKLLELSLPVASAEPAP
jgi:hypothetical protein